MPRSASATRPFATPRRSPASPRLRLLPKRDRPSSGAPTPASTAAAAAAGEPQTRHSARPVLIAGKDPEQRADVLEQLARTMPENTRFEQAEAFWEVLVQAPASRMVILSGELDELSAESLLHTIGHRHPDLPVVSFEQPAPGAR